MEHNFELDIYGKRRRFFDPFAFKLKLICAQVYIESFSFCTVLQFNQLIFDEQSGSCKVFSICNARLRKKSFATKYKVS